MNNLNVHKPWLYLYSIIKIDHVSINEFFIFDYMMMGLKVFSESDWEGYTVMKYTCLILLYTYKMKFSLPTSDWRAENKEALAMWIQVWHFIIVPMKQNSWSGSQLSCIQEDAAGKCSLTAVIKFKVRGTSLAGQWLRFCAPNAGGPSLIPGQGTRSCNYQLCAQAR